MFYRSAIILTTRFCEFSPGWFRRITVLCAVFILGSTSAFAQGKRMAAIGSSTTAGYKASSLDSCWFGRFTRYYKCQLGVMDSSYNFGIPGDNVYAGMPSSYKPPPGRPNPDATTNITKAEVTLRSLRNKSDGVIIVNYPSNEYDIYSIAEIMKCLQVIYDSTTRSGNKCFITTTQPRSDSPFNSSAIKKKMADIKDSTINRFGEAHTLNFWDGMFNPADTTILPIYSGGDQVHFNDLGHRILFERIMAKNVFSLPVWYAAASGNLNALATWGSNPNGTGTHPASFALDNQVFIVVNNLAPTINANWILSGKNVQLIIGDGIRPVVFKIPAAYRLTISNPQAASICN